MKRQIITVLLSASGLLGMASISNAYAQSAPATPSAEKVNYAEDSQGGGAAVDDTMITSKVKAALSSDPSAAALRIDVNTRQGVVFVSGAVPSNELRDHVAQLIATVDGVRTVRNELKIMPAENQ